MADGNGRLGARRLRRRREGRRSKPGLSSRCRWRAGRQALRAWRRRDWESRRGDRCRDGQGAWHRCPGRGRGQLRRRHCDKPRQFGRVKRRQGRQARRERRGICGEDRRARHSRFGANSPNDKLWNRSGRRAGFDWRGGGRCRSRRRGPRQDFGGAGSGRRRRRGGWGQCRGQARSRLGCCSGCCGGCCSESRKRRVAWRNRLRSAGGWAFGVSRFMSRQKRRRGCRLVGCSQGCRQGCRESCSGCWCVCISCRRSPAHRRRSWRGGRRQFLGNIGLGGRFRQLSRFRGSGFDGNQRERDFGAAQVTSANCQGDGDVTQAPDNAQFKLQWSRCWNVLRL